MVISADGRVPACCLDYNYFVAPKTGYGSVSQQSLGEVWRTEEFRRLRFDLAHAETRNIPDLCRRCVNMYEVPDRFEPPVLADESIMLWRSPYNYGYRFKG
jgi:hypothetical protein